MKNRFAPFVAAGILLLDPVIAACLPPKPPIAEQRNFGAEDDQMQNPVDLPAGVMEILKQDQGVQDFLV
jgi:hypothetical protein